MLRPDGTYRKTRRSGHEAGDVHEFTFTCYRRFRLLSKDRTRLWLAGALDRARRVHDLELWSYVIMPDHAHVLLRPRRPDADMGAILKSIKQSVARRAIRFLRLNAADWLDRLKVTYSDGRTLYHFWQPGGGYDRNIISARVAWASVDYIHANPVRRGLTSAPTDWDWSSARWYAGIDDVRLAMDARPPDPTL